MNNNYCKIRNEQYLDNIAGYLLEDQNEIDFEVFCVECMLEKYIAEYRMINAWFPDFYERLYPILEGERAKCSCFKCGVKIETFYKGGME